MFTVVLRLIASPTVAYRDGGGGGGACVCLHACVSVGGDGGTDNTYELLGRVPFPVWWSKLTLLLVFTFTQTFNILDTLHPLTQFSSKSSGGRRSPNSTDKAIYVTHLSALRQPYLRGSKHSSCVQLSRFRVGIMLCGPLLLF